MAPVDRSSEITFRSNLEDPGHKWEVAAPKGVNLPAEPEGGKN